MKSAFCCSVVFGSIIACSFVSADNQLVDQSYDFQELAEPNRNISGAYYGLGYDLSFFSHKINATNSATSAQKSIKKSGTQNGIALIGGFGSCFKRDYYIGIEFEIMHRLAGKTSYEGDLCVKFTKQFGINMDVRFGRLFHQLGRMLYATAGFSRALGKIVTNANDANGFGSYFPTFGVGFEQKLNASWNFRVDARYSITSKDTDKVVRTSVARYSCSAKPQRMSIRLAITKNI